MDDAALLVRDGKVWFYYKGRKQGKGAGDTKMGVAFADSPTSLMWRLQNDGSAPIGGAPVPGPKAEADEAIFTEVSLDVRPEDKAAAAAAPWLVRK